ncbi:MAG: hypothetical protein DMG97_12355 [Acidobacteria bacterium]|nr:MAG: hypothetical protein DMG97_12355 [Acidobacteriota bacterium]PYV78705.1 MAG: hypothetical protein DMG96_07140 [Acidobacteriota bacterium]
MADVLDHLWEGYLLAPPSSQPLEQRPIGIHKDQGWFTIFEIQPSPTTKARLRLLLRRSGSG